MPTVKVLFICMGNICRSPTAEGIFTAMLRDKNLTDKIEVDSAGTANYHTGNPPDDRAAACAREHGYNIDNLRARQVCLSDFDRFDYLMAMDCANLSELESMKPVHWQGRLALILDYHPSLPKGSEVPDPYFGGQNGFIRVTDMLEKSCHGLLESIMEQHYWNSDRHKPC